MEDKTPILKNLAVSILDVESTTLTNFRTMTQFIKHMPLTDKTEMLLTLAAFCRSELNG